jgi:hypothetical protein
MKVFINNRLQKVISPRDPYNDKNDWGIFIPGSWVIRKSFLQEVGCYDENIKYAENTELSFRIKKLNPKKGFVDKENFNYYQSEAGGSKNLSNKIEANLYIIKKHKDFFKSYPHALKLYLQNTAVAMIRLSKFREGRKMMWRAFCVNPFDLKGLFRLLLCLSPIISKRIWH